MIGAGYGGDDLTVLVAPEDIATAVAEEFENPCVGRRICYVASDELTCNEVAHILGKAIGMPDLKWILVPGEQIQTRLEALGMPQKMAASLVELQNGHHTGIIAEDYLRNRPFSLGRIKTADFAKDFADAFFRNK